MRKAKHSKFKSSAVNHRMVCDEYADRDDQELLDIDKEDDIYGEARNT